MLLDGPSHPSLPLLGPLTHFSFSARGKTTLRSHPVDHILRSPSTSTSTATASSSSSPRYVAHEFGSVPASSQTARQARKRRRPEAGNGAGFSSSRGGGAGRTREYRATQRVLTGRAMAGTALAEEAIDLSEEENALEEERVHIDSFGHRFLLPFGRRLTQMEMEAGQPQSPTPSDVEHEHRQEDQNGADVAQRDLDPMGQVNGGGLPDAESEEEGVIDLDASIEDRDAEDDYDDVDGDGEGEVEGRSGEMLELDDNAVEGYGDDEGDMSVEE